MKWILIISICKLERSTVSNHFPFTFTDLFSSFVCRCWTQGKPDKLIYLRKSKMWYLTEQCSPLPNLISGAELSKQEFEEMSIEAGVKMTKQGDVYKQAAQYFSLPKEEQWKQLSSLCCNQMPGAP
jgi:hypothetical protein